MTQQDDITQPVLTDADLLRICQQFNPGQDLDLAKAVRDALLSKLRAPVADTRLHMLVQEAITWIETGGGTAVSLCADLRAALASAPVKPWPVEEQPDGTVTPVDPADMTSAPVAGEALFWYRPRSDGGYEGPIHNDRIEEARKRSGAWVPLVAAPQAGAHGVGQTQAAAYLTLDEEGSPCMLFFDVVEARGYCAPGEEPEPLFRHAAPQASAESVDLPGIDADRLRTIAASGSQTAMSNALLNVARALKQPQAAKDGDMWKSQTPEQIVAAMRRFARSEGFDWPDPASAEGIRSPYNACMHRNECRAMLDRQQRAAFDHPVFAFLLGEGQLHGVDFGERAPGAVGKWWWRKDLRAALSATQPEQGERDE